MHFPRSLLISLHKFFRTNTRIRTVLLTFASCGVNFTLIPISFFDAAVYTRNTPMYCDVIPPRKNGLNLRPRRRRLRRRCSSIQKNRILFSNYMYVGVYICVRPIDLFHVVRYKGEKEKKNRKYCIHPSRENLLLATPIHICNEGTTYAQRYIIRTLAWGKCKKTLKKAPEVIRSTMSRTRTIFIYLCT